MYAHGYAIAFVIFGIISGPSKQGLETKFK
jgi:hypothetical protein